MLTENCILKNIGTACPCGGAGTLTDRKGARFPVVRDGASCRSIVLNAVPLYMADRMDDLRSTGGSCAAAVFYDGRSCAMPRRCAGPMHPARRRRVRHIRDFISTRGYFNHDRRQDQVFASIGHKARICDGRQSWIGSSGCVGKPADSQSACARGGAGRHCNQIPKGYGGFIFPTEAGLR